MKRRIKQLKSELRYGDKQMIANTLGISLPPIRKAFQKECGFSDLDIKIYKVASNIINDRKQQIKNL